MSFACLSVDVPLSQLSTIHTALTGLTKSGVQLQISGLKFKTPKRSVLTNSSRASSRTVCKPIATHTSNSNNKKEVGDQKVIDEHPETKLGKRTYSQAFPTNECHLSDDEDLDESDSDALSDEQDSEDDPPLEECHGDERKFPDDDEPSAGSAPVPVAMDLSSNVVASGP